jgi:hypothetical protein
VEAVKTLRGLRREGFASAAKDVENKRFWHILPNIIYARVSTERFAVSDYLYFPAECVFMGADGLRGGKRVAGLWGAEDDWRRGSDQENGSG